MHLAITGGGSSEPKNHPAYHPAHYTPQKPHPAPVHEVHTSAPAPKKTVAAAKPASKVDEVHISAMAHKLAQLDAGDSAPAGSTNTHKAESSTPKSSGGFFSNLWSHVTKAASNVVHTAEHVEHAVTQTVSNAVSTATDDAESMARVAIHRTEQVVQRVGKDVASVDTKVVHEAKHVAQTVHRDIQTVRRDIQASASAVQHQAKAAYEKAKQAVHQEATTIVHRVENTAHQVEDRAQHVAHDVAVGAGNLAKHPLATAGAVGDLVGGAAEAVGGVVAGVATSETVVGAVIGAAAAVDGTAKTVSGARDLASIFNGNMNQVGTHNVLRNMAQQAGGQKAVVAYETVSFGLSFVGGGVSDVAKVGSVITEHSSQIAQAVRDGIQAVRDLGSVGGGRLTPALEGASVGGSRVVHQTTQVERDSQVMMAETHSTSGGTKGTESANHNENTVRIINKKYAGKTYHLDGELGSKYPNGVQFNQDGFPNFSPYSKATVKVKGLTGKNSDFTAVNKAVGLKSTPAGYTWHHVEDGKTMQLVPTDLHSAVKHTGGAALLRKGVVPK